MAILLRLGPAGVANLDLAPHIVFRARHLAEGGLERLVADLHPRVRWRGGTLHVSTRPSERRDLLSPGTVSEHLGALRA
jgi:hypothetical protein